MTGLMFPFITKTWNPLGGECKGGCPYCWAKKLADRNKMNKYQGPPRLYNKEFKKIFREHEFIFVQSMNDLLGSWVPTEYIERVLNFCRTSPAKFLLLTKNPARYLTLNLPDNVTAGATIETDIGLDRNDRFTVMAQVRRPKMLSIEPIMYFSKFFVSKVILSDPDFVAIGYDNYNSGLDEPLLDNVNELIYDLEKTGIKVYKKTLRECNQIVTPGE